MNIQHHTTDTIYLISCHLWENLSHLFFNWHDDELGISRINKFDRWNDLKSSINRYSDSGFGVKVILPSMMDAVMGDMIRDGVNVGVLIYEDMREDIDLILSHPPYEVLGYFQSILDPDWENIPTASSRRMDQRTLSAMRFELKKWVRERAINYSDERFEHAWNLMKADLLKTSSAAVIAFPTSIDYPEEDDGPKLALAAAGETPDIIDHNYYFQEGNIEEDIVYRIELVGDEIKIDIESTNDKHIGRKGDVYWSLSTGELSDRISFVLEPMDDFEGIVCAAYLVLPVSDKAQGLRIELADIERG